MTPEIDIKDFKVYQPPLILGKVDRPFNEYVKSLCYKLFFSSPADNTEERSRLAGNLKHEYALTPELQDAIKPVIEAAFFDRFNENQRAFDYPELLKIDWMFTWCNFQRKYEFNPVHTHSGKYTFVWWVNIPFDIKDEMELEWVKGSNSASASCFQFDYFPINAVKAVQQTFFLSREKDEGTFLIFPSNIPHQVYPFYTSDELRISISGNFDFGLPHGFN